jgi:predicted MFS family arabinose efflux permease
MYLQKKTDPNKTFLPVLLLTILPVGSAILFRDQLPFFGAYLIYNALHAIRMPLLQTLIANRATAENSNSMMGFYQSMNSLGSIFGALFAGLIYAANPMYPFILAFLAFTAACLIGTAYVKRYSA